MPSTNCRLEWGRPFNLNVDPFLSGYGVVFIDHGPYREGDFIRKTFLARYVTDYVFPTTTSFGIPRPPPPEPEVFNDPLDDNGSSLYFLPPLNALTGFPRYVVCPEKVKYKIMNDGVSRFFDFDEETGLMSGRMMEMDYFISDLSFQKFNSTNYAKEGSASLFSNGRGKIKRIFLKVRAYLESNPSTYIEDDFFIDAMNNWSFDRDALISGPRSIDDTFFIEGLPASKQDYLDYMKNQGFFNS